MRYGTVVGMSERETVTDYSPQQPCGYRYVGAAMQIADATLKHLVSSDGVLVEPAINDRDQQSFKGIFALHLARLVEVPALPSPKRAVYAAFLQHNADVVMASDRLPDGRFGATWQGPVTPGADGDGALQPSTAATTSAVMLLTAAATAADALSRLG
jgi:predicted alpha-1,6-mannanase (GH76 family)